MSPYRRRMHCLATIWKLALALGLLCLAQAAAAQAALKADWTNLGLTDYQPVNNGAVLTVGPNAITINTRIVTDGDANDASFKPYFSTAMMGYYSGQMGAQVGTLVYNMDHAVFDVGDYYETTYTFRTGVENLAFVLANVDRKGGPYQHDGVVIEYDTGDGAWINTRSTPGIATLSNVIAATLNGQSGYQGNATAASVTSPNYGISIAFGPSITVKRVRIRYMFGQDYPTQDPSAAEQYMGLSDFTWTQPIADLSLTKTVSNASPAAGATISYTITVANAGPAAATGVIVRDLLPAGFNFVSASTTSGSYNSATGDWTAISVGSGQSRTLTITGNVGASPGVTIANTAEVWYSPNYDPDSTPGNGAAEDDRAIASFTVQGRTAGTAPLLTCPAGSSLFDWDVRSWASGSLANSYAMTNIGIINFAISSPGTFTGSPQLNASNNGGVAGSQVSLYQSIDFATRDQTATTVITLPTAVPGAQFRVFDVDYAANDFADTLTVTGGFNGSPVTPVLTNGVSNYVIGNTAIGDGASDATSGNGNVTVTFASPVDTITIVYGNAATAPANPNGQAISIWDITFCNPVAVLGVTKVSTLISDPANGVTNPRAIPGAVVEYCILVQNPGSGTATNVSGVDNIPATLTYTAGSLLSGTSCGAASTVEDDNATGADESDPYGASVAGQVVTATAATLGPGVGFALKYRTTVK